MSDALRTLSGRSELLAVTADDPFVRWECDDALLSRAWALGDAVAFLRTSHFRGTTHLNVFGSADDAGRLLDALAGERVFDGVVGISVEQSLLAVAQSRFDLTSGGNWDWMWTSDTPPMQPGEATVVELDDTADGPELLRLNQIGSPTAESRPGEGVTELWLGVREHGRILAAGAMHRSGGGAPELAGIVTHPDTRGRGFGAAVTAALTREAVARAGVCTLGMYSDNDIARRLYYRLGFRTAHAWASRGFAKRHVPLVE